LGNEGGAPNDGDEEESDVGFETHECPLRKDGMDFTAMCIALKIKNPNSPV
jgi:hypothetical protein